MILLSKSKKINERLETIEAETEEDKCQYFGCEFFNNRKTKIDFECTEFGLQAVCSKYVEGVGYKHVHTLYLEDYPTRKEKIQAIKKLVKALS